MTRTRKQLGRTILALVLLAALCGCTSKEERYARYLAKCQEHDFNVKQCDLLIEMETGAKDAATQAQTNALMMGIIIGGAGGRR